MGVVLLVLVSVSLLASVSGNGRMFDPIARNAAWRLNLGTPKDFKDDMQDCGGFETQWNEENRGRCGVCGDAWNSKKPQNVFPGKYATGKITKHYRRGQAFNLDIQITENLGGWSEFRVGKIGTLPMTSEKLTHLLELEDGSGTRWSMPEGTGFFHVRLRLPEDLMCDNCVLQWMWRAGNNWACDSEGKCERSKAKEQKTIVNCADITILEEDGTTPKY